MALRNAQTTSDVSAPAFEAMDAEVTHVAKPSAPANESPARPITAAAANPAVSTAVPAAPANTLALITMPPPDASGFAAKVMSMKGAADFSWGNYKVFKATNNGSIRASDDKTSLGRWVKVTMLAWDDHFEVSPNSKAEKSKDALAFSKDGRTIDRVLGDEFADWIGRPPAEYVKFLQTEHGYETANFRRFIDISCVVHEAESEDVFNGEIVQITLTQSSIPSFSQYQEQLKQKAVAVASGVVGVKVPADPFTFYLMAIAASANGNDWVKLQVVNKLPTKF